MGLLQRLLEPLRNQRGQVNPFTGEPLGDPLDEVLRRMAETGSPFTETGGASTGPGRAPSPPSAPVSPEDITFPGEGGFGRQTLAEIIARAKFQQQVEEAQAFEKEQEKARLARLAAPTPGVSAPTGPSRRLLPTRFAGAPQGRSVGIGFAPGSAGAQLGNLIQQITRQLSTGEFGGPSRADLLDPRLADISRVFAQQRGRRRERAATLGRSLTGSQFQERAGRLAAREALERQRATGNVDEFLARLQQNRQTQLINLLSSLLSGAPGALAQGGTIRV